MKTKIVLIIALCIQFIMANAQNYQEEMKKAITKLNNAETVEDLRAVANHFERISTVNNTEWIPFYYLAYSYVKINYLSESNDAKDKLLDKAEAEYKKAVKIKNSDKAELKVLQAYILQAKFSVNYIGRLSMNTQALNILKEVIANSPENPRAYFLLGVALYKMPAFVGGSKSKACDNFKLAQEKFAQSFLESDISPDWGRELNNIWLKRCAGDEK